MQIPDDHIVEVYLTEEELDTVLLALMDWEGPYSKDIVGKLTEGEKLYLLQRTTLATQMIKKLSDFLKRRGNSRCM